MSKTNIISAPLLSIKIFYFPLQWCILFLPINFTLRCFVLCLIQTGLVVVEKKYIHVFPLISHYMHFLLERGVSFAINKFEFTFCKNGVYCPSGFWEGDENVKYIHTTTTTMTTTTTTAPTATKTMSMEDRQTDQDKVSLKNKTRKT